MRIVAEQNLTQQLEGAATSPAQATPFKQFLLPLEYRRQALAPIVLVLDVIVTFAWMAFLGYGLIALIFWAFRALA